MNIANVKRYAMRNIKEKPMAQQIKITQTSNADMNIGFTNQWKDTPPNIGGQTKETAVEWLVDQIKSDQNQKALSASEWMEVIEKAKQMEKEQMKSIEPPSDEEIESGMNQRLFLSDKHAHFNSGAKAGFKLGAEWMKEQILNQNK